MRAILILLVILLLTLQYRLWVGQGSWAQISALETEIEQQELVNQGLRERNSIVEKDVHALKNGMDAIEERARTDLGLIKEGETFYMFVDKNRDD
jgi:cell division protein FtsB